MRREYSREALAEADVDADPVVQFGRWFEQAEQAGLLEPTAMTLATATPDGRPSARMVLLRGFDERGFCFYTNYESRKGAELAANPRAALVFWWGELERQVRIEGPVAPTSRAESEAYFHSRPPGSQLSAAASPQSRVLADRAVLERRVAELAAGAADGQVPLPDFWGGYRLTHEVVEFWQGRPNRLHDRLRYCRAGDGWKIERLAP
jgi:pyridoxamine 5'-phosphate oxidase